MTQLTIQQAFDLAVQHHRAGRLPEAEQLYRQVLVQQPAHVDAMHNLGSIAHRAGRNDVAIELFRRAVALRPNFPQAHANLGDALRATGQLEEAITAFRQAIVLNPSNPEGHNNLGIDLKENGQPVEAIAAYRKAIALKPDFPEAYFNLGNALNYVGQLDEAIAAFQQAIAFRPNFAEAHNNLGAVLKDKGRHEESIAACRRAIELKPNYAEAHYNLGNALREKSQLEDAAKAYRRAIVLNPDYAEAHHNLSLALLARGDFQEGWEEHEWRWKCKGLAPPRNFTQPLWDGGPWEGRTLLLHAEQGFGDTLQFLRYPPLVARRGGKIILECQPELQRLFQIVAGEIQTVAAGQSLPAFDFQCPLLSLPRALGATLGDLPHGAAYLRADPRDAENWRRRLEDHGSVLKVGLVWAGKPIQQNDRIRSMKLAGLTRLAQIPGIRFFSLQKGEGAKQIKNPPAGMELVDWTADLKDFADTAALIANLDLVIAVDTAVAHLSGAMGKPTWTLLSFVSDWRWMVDREDSPWYPSMRLFRQASQGDWESVITRVAEALSVWTKNRT